MPESSHAPASTPAVAALQAENRRLRSQLDTLLHEARLNQEKMHRFDQLERQLIGAHSLAELVEILLSNYKQTFDLDAVTLALVDPESEAAHILAAGQADPAAGGGLIFLRTEDYLRTLYGTLPKPLLETFQAARHRPLLDPDSPPPQALASVALLPLQRPGALIGSLNLGSCQPERFAAGNSTDFLARLAAILAVCLDGALSHERLKRVGLTDPLTGIHNRRYFESRCLEEVALARRQTWPLACMFLDVDHFKKLNDSFGHQVGDDVLRHVARLVKQQLRGSDVMARYGGEEFVVLLPNTPLKAACDIAERIRLAIAAKDFALAPAQRLQVTISIGVSMLAAAAGQRSAEELAGQLVNTADKALYRAKKGGRNRVEADIAATPP